MNTEHSRKTLATGYSVVVYYDPYPDSPRNWDNVGTVVLLDRCRYDFGDETAGQDELARIARDPDNICLPIYIYDHSGITINTTGFSCPWDSGQVGLIYCTKDRARKEWGRVYRQRALACLKGEIETLDQYLTGQVYGYVVRDPQGEELDSCWGFYGDAENCMAEGEAVARHHEKEPGLVD